jgi:hypothetical protein
MSEPQKTSKWVALWSRYGAIGLVGLLVIFFALRSSKFSTVLFGATAGSTAVVLGVVGFALVCYALLWLLQKVR